jgi:predicted alpha/beta superfamily hydrolase
MYRGHIIIAPSLVWNDKSSLKLVTEYFSKHKVLNNIVYIAYGSLDSKKWIINPTTELIQIIQTQNYQGLNFATQIFEGETHISVFPTALTSGLKTVFKR